MRKMYYLMLMLLISTVSMNAQVTIGSQSDPHGGAVLDLQSPSNNKGLKMPQVALTSATVWAPLTGAAVDGMMVYNTANITSNGLNGRGIYVWSDSKWNYGGGANSVANVIAVTGLSLDQSSIALTVGGSQTLTPTFAPGNATNQAINWTTSNTLVATVDNTGKVTAVGQGSAIITATSAADGTKKATCNVNVSPATIAVTGVSISGASSVEEGSTLSLLASVSPSNATNQGIIWSVYSGGTYVSVNQSGVVTGIAAGSAEIRATANDGSGVYASKTISVTAKTNADGSTTMKINGKDYLTYDYNGTIWMVQNSSEGTASVIGSNGNFYTWQNAFSACPPGWSLPTATQWNALVSIVGSDTSGIGKWWNNNAYGAFAGFMFRGNELANDGVGGSWWSASALEQIYESEGTMYGPGTSGWSTHLITVRCVKN